MRWNMQIWIVLAVYLGTLAMKKCNYTPFSIFQATGYKNVSCRNLGVENPLPID